MGEPKLVYHETLGMGHYASASTHTKAGDFFVFANGPKPFSIISRDNGKTFEKIDGVKMPSTYGFKELSDGTFISFCSDNIGHRKLINPKQKKLPYVLGIRRAKSFDDIISGNVDTDFAIVDIPDLAFGYGDSGNSHTSVTTQGVIELENGDIIVAMYGQKTTDTTVCPYFDRERDYRFYLYSTWCIISRDGGRSFEYLSDIADVQKYPIPDVNAEGYCETELLYLGGGHIVSVIRTGGHEVSSPMYCTHSYDSGRTWTVPEAIVPYGVLPKLIKLSDGRLLLLSGHFHTYIMTSHDEGKTWNGPYILEFCDGLWDKSPSGYNSVFESGENEITVIYDDPKEGIAEGGREMLRTVYLRKYDISEI